MWQEEILYGQNLAEPQVLRFEACDVAVIERGRCTKYRRYFITRKAVAVQPSKQSNKDLEFGGVAIRVRNGRFLILAITKSDIVADEDSSLIRCKGSVESLKPI